MLTIGGKIRELRRSSSITLGQLGEMVGSSKSYLSEIENDKSPRPSAQTLSRIARALGVTVDYLMGNGSDVSTAEDDAFCRKYRELDPDTRARIRHVVDALVD